MVKFPAFAISGRRQFIHGAESRRKRLLAVIAGKQGNFRQRQVGFNQQPGRFCQPAAQQISVQGQAGNLRKHAVQVKSGITGRVGNG